MAFWSGLILGRVWPLDLPGPSAGLSLGLAIISAGLLLILGRLRPNPRFLLPLAPFLFLGLALITPYSKSLDPDPAGPLNKFYDQALILTGTVIRTPDERAWGTYLVVELESVSDGRINSPDRPLDGRIRLRLGARTTWPKLGYGTRIRFQTKLRRITDFANFTGSGNLFSYRTYLSDRGISGRANLKNPAGLLILDRSGGRSWWRVVEEVRARARELLQEAASPAGAGLLRAVLLGDKNGLSKETKEAFRLTGTAHLLVVSGLHLALLGALVYGLLRWLFSRSTRLMLRINILIPARLLAILPVFGYALLAGPATPTWRAFLLILVTGLGWAWGRTRDNLSGLALAGLLIPLVWPPALFSIGFQLSFLAVATMLLIADRMPDRPEPIDWAGRQPETGLLPIPFRPFAGSLVGIRAVRYLLGLIMTTVVINLALAPLLAFNFGRVPLLGLILNLALVPLYTLIVVPLGLVGLALGLVGLPGSTWLLGLAGYLAEPGAELALGVAGWAWAGVPVVGLTRLEIGLVYLALGGAVVSLLSTRRRIGLALLLAGLLGLGVDTGFWLVRNHSPELKATFLDVGQGSSTLLRMPGGKAWLVDGGGLPGSFDLGQAVLGPALWARKIKAVERIVLTHPHPDHFRGLEYILDHFSPKSFIFPDWETSDPDLLRILAKVREAGLERFGLDRLKAGLGTEKVRVQVLWPSQIPDIGTNPKQNYRLENDFSIVLRVIHQEVRLLLTGDIGAVTEAELVRLHDAGRIDLRAEVLLVPHHGSRTSSSPAFLERVRPRLAVISCGPGNRFNQPHPEVVQRLAGSGAKILQTAKQGAITIISDGRSFRTETALMRAKQ